MRHMVRMFGEQYVGTVPGARPSLLVPPFNHRYCCLSVLQDLPCPLPLLLHNTLMGFIKHKVLCTLKICLFPKFGM